LTRWTTEVCITIPSVTKTFTDIPAEIQAYLKSLNGQGTVPHVYLGGKFVGGCSELQALSNDKIKKMISA
jgi:glutaredoxin